MTYIAPDASQRIVDPEGLQTQITRDFFRQVAQSQVLTGAGSPEGILAADPTTLYMDETPGATPVLYIKQQAEIASDRRFGWVGV